MELHYLQFCNKDHQVTCMHNPTHMILIKSEWREIAIQLYMAWMTNTTLNTVNSNKIY